jgi:hypothetical protein
MAIKFKNAALFIALALLIFSGFTNYKLFKLNRQYRNALPYFLVGETIDYLGLQSTEENGPDLKELPDNKVSILYIFSQPCTPCDKNLIYLKKFARLLDKSAAIRGVVVGDLSEAYEFVQNAKPGFDVYVPEDLNRFTDAFRLKFKHSHLLVCRGKEVQFVKMGELTSDEFTQIIKMIRSMK